MAGLSVLCCMPLPPILFSYIFITLHRLSRRVALKFHGLLLSWHRHMQIILFSCSITLPKSSICWWPLSLYGLAAGLHVNFDKSKFFPLKQCDWHALLWPDQIVHSVRHLGYPIEWRITRKQHLKWICEKLHNYWKFLLGFSMSDSKLFNQLSWPMSSSICVWCIGLPKDISAFMSQAMEILWKTRTQWRHWNWRRWCSPRNTWWP